MESKSEGAVKTKTAIAEAKTVAALDTLTASKPRSLWGDVLRRYLRHRIALLGTIVLLLIIIACVLAPVISPYDPTKTSILDRYVGPSGEHLMGTDDLGRDQFTRILYGGQISILIGFLSVTISILIGLVIGAVAGYFGGWVDNVLMRFTDFALAFPSLFLLILLVSVYGSQFWIIVLVIGGLRWMSTARLVRSSFLSLKEKEFVEAARAVGSKNFRIAVKHILPNALGPLIVTATLGMAGGVIAESSLSFLGLGIQKPLASWGNMLQDAQDVVNTAPWMAIFPGLMIFLTVLSINFIGDGLRDALDPRGKLR
jgi:peptide/nickel transport system permease protein